MRILYQGSSHLERIREADLGNPVGFSLMTLTRLHSQSSTPMFEVAMDSGPGDATDASDTDCPGGNPCRDKDFAASHLAATMIITTGVAPINIQSTGPGFFLTLRTSV